MAGGVKGLFLHCWSRSQACRLLRRTNSSTAQSGLMEVVSANGRRVIVGRDVDVEALLRILRGLEALR
ncbi:hypothetical protein EV132_15410 [Rhizobium sullae]|uniref:Uncharacterized protein n=1 Tax=Rhizobium sullae TaxID=50338 RepID=A0A4R3PV11_RHISU|nr:hypothetical protein EV132_15410 [Rhizobium sullae]